MEIKILRVRGSLGERGEGRGEGGGGLNSYDVTDGMRRTGLCLYMYMYVGGCTVKAKRSEAKRRLTALEMWMNGQHHYII